MAGVWTPRVNRGKLRTLLVVAACLLGAPTGVTMLAGAAIVLPGILLHLWSKGCLRQNLELTTAGPYRWTRNPFYLANLLVEVGIGVASANPWILAVYLPLWFFVYLRTIRREETALAPIFGEKLAAYCARVPKLFPNPFRGPFRPVEGAFSWSNSNLAQGSEYGRMLRLTSYLPLMWTISELRIHGRMETHLLAWQLAAVAAVVLFGASLFLIRKARRPTLPPLLLPLFSGASATMVAFLDLFRKTDGW